MSPFVVQRDAQTDCLQRAESTGPTLSPSTATSPLQEEASRLPNVPELTPSELEQADTASNTGGQTDAHEQSEAEQLPLHEPVQPPSPQNIVLIDLETPEPDVEPGSTSNPQPKTCKDGRLKRSGLKEGMRRTPHSLLFKWRVAVDYQYFRDLKAQGILSNPLQRTSEQYHGLAESNIFKWHVQRDKLQRVLMHELSGCTVKKGREGKIISFSTKQARRCSLSTGRTLKFGAAEAELLKEFKAQRKAGLKVTERWLCITMKRHILNHYGEEAAATFKASYGWLWKFCSRNNLSWRRSNNHKHQDVQERLPRIKRWHARLRLRLKQGPPGKVHPTWGRWLPENRLSVDQVPCNLREGIRATYEEKGSQRIWIAGTKADDGKRFCTLQICARAHNGDVAAPRRGQPKIGVIFRGQGLRVSEEEKRAWHPDCRVRFQPKAWADANYCVEHAMDEMAEATADARAKGQQSVAFYDNLHGQTTKEHEQALLTKANCIRHLLPGGVTSEIQLIDDGIGYATKREMGHELDNWLMQPGHLEKWTSEGGLGFPMWQKRALITHLAVKAWDKVCHTFDFEKAATRIGMRMTITGEGDDQIQLQGVANYHFCEADAALEPGERNNGVDPEEEEELARVVPGSDGDAAPANDDDGQIEGPQYDSSEDEDDTDAPDTVGPPPLVPPKGFAYVSDPPPLATEEEQKSLVGSWIVLAMATPSARGWFRGRVASKGVSTKDLRNTPTANFVVSFDKKVTQSKHVHGRVATTLLPTNYGPSEWWILLQPSVADSENAE